MTDFDPTPQQQAIIDAALEGNDVTVHALAGTGKTSTLVAVAEHLKEEHPKKRVLYLAFNKATQVEADERMPRNVESVTANAMAHRAVPEHFSDRLNTRGLRIRDALESIGGHVPTVSVDLFGRGGLTVADKWDFARLARETMTRWCQSADPAPTRDHVPYPQRNLFGRMRSAFDTMELYRAGWSNEEFVKIADTTVRHVRRWWDEVIDPYSDLPVTFDMEVKLWALSGAEFDEVGSGAKRPVDVVMLDEAQDTNPVLGELVAAQSIQKIIVGDSHQAIYGWRGAVDYLDRVISDVTLPLTVSWRFGPEVAASANCVLGRLQSEHLVEGRGRPGVVGTLDNPQAVIIRTNAEMLKEVYNLQEQGLVVGAPSGTAPALKSLVETIMWLLGEAKKPFNPSSDLADFDTWDAVVKESEEDPSSAAADAVKLVEEHNIRHLSRALSKLVDVSPGGRKRHDVLVTTAHKAKGLEWNRVRIGDDFPSPRIERDGTVTYPTAEELRLAYVALTRAKRNLDPGSLAWLLEGSEEVEPLDEEDSEQVQEVWNRKIRGAVDVTFDVDPWAA